MASSLALLITQAKAMDDQLPCRRENPQLWFSDLPPELELAKAYCRPCPMRRVCLAGAVERHEPHGVWGGGDLRPRRDHPGEKTARPAAPQAAAGYLS